MQFTGVFQQVPEGYTALAEELPGANTYQAVNEPFSKRLPGESPRGRDACPAATSFVKAAGRVIGPVAQLTPDRRGDQLKVQFVRVVGRCDQPDLTVRAAGRLEARAGQAAAERVGGAGVPAGRE